jgi:hypothetical protein
MKNRKFRWYLLILIVLITAAISIGINLYLRVIHLGANYYFRPQVLASYSTNTVAMDRSSTTRDKWLWPFSQDSIWNLPIGSNAQYSPANLPKAAKSSVDYDLLFKIPANSPLRPLYNPGSWTKRCSGTKTYENLSIRIPDDLIVPDAINLVFNYSTPNNAAALLQPDGKTIIQLEPMARCVQAGPVYGYRWPRKDLDLYGQGIAGGHLGSGLSSIGGTIRKGELISNQPIRHVLKLELWEKYLNYNPASPTPGYRWPADRTDGAASSMYKGNNPQIVMGTLFAIPPNITANSLGLTTPAGKKLFKALQDYGGYQVDTTGIDGYAIAIESGVDEEFKSTYGYDMVARESSNNPFYQDFMKLFQALHIVTNNSPTSVGGGGIRRAPLAPPFADEYKIKSASLK